MSRPLPGPKRDMPSDFAEMFPRLGWEEIEEHYRTGQTTIRRWMREVGEAELILKRRAYLRKVYASRGIPTIMGRKPAQRFGGLPEMEAGDPALDWMPVRRLRRPWRGEL